MQVAQGEVFLLQMVTTVGPPDRTRGDHDPNEVGINGAAISLKNANNSTHNAVALHLVL